MSDDERQAIATNVQLAVDRLGQLTGFPFGLDRRSVEWVDGFIERQRARPDFDVTAVDGLIGVLGAHLGECLVVATAGAWHRDENGWGVRLLNGTVAFPFAKVRKQFERGRSDGESIFSFYEILVDYVATGKLDESRRAAASGQQPAQG